MARKAITFTNLIPVNGTYYPTQDITEEEAERIRKYTDKPVSLTAISEKDGREWAERTAERVSKRLSEYYTQHIDEFKRIGGMTNDQ